MVQTIPTPFPIPKKHHRGDAETSVVESEILHAISSSDLAKEADLHIQEFHGAGVCSEDGDRNPNVEEIKEVEVEDVENFYDALTDLEFQEQFSQLSKLKAAADEILSKLKINEDSRNAAQLIITRPSSEYSMDSEQDSSDPEYPPSDGDDEYLQEYNNFMAGIRKLVKTETKLVFELNSFFEHSLLFPLKLDWTQYIPVEVVTTKTLKTVKIMAPKTFCFPTGLPNVQEGDSSEDNAANNTICYSEEKIIRNRVLFLLRTIQSHVLEQFTFINNCGGIKLDKMNRISVWQHALETFLNRHSSTLEKITIRTLLSNSAVISTCYELLSWDNKFLQLQELDIIFFITPRTKEKDYDHAPFLENYWIKLLCSRGRLGQLRRLAWMYPVELSVSEIWEPIFRHNRKSLRVLHILTSNNQLESEMKQMSFTYTEENLYTCISCSVFAEMSNLESLYLRKSSCFLQRLELLPSSLTELSLDGHCLESCEIISALSKLVNLKKLRLVNNMVTFLALEYQAFGVNLDVITAIMNHRKLDDLFIWGYALTQQVIPTDFKKPKSRSRFHSFKTMCSSLKLKLTRANPNRSKLTSQPIPTISTIMDALKKIAIMNNHSICIKDDTCLKI